MTLSVYRVQLHRTKGWRMPDGAVVVARPSKWGNPFTKKACIEAGYNTRTDPVTGKQSIMADHEIQEWLADIFRSWLLYGPASPWWYGAGAERWQHMHDNIRELYGKQLACWCPLDSRCHADVLHELAHGLVVANHLTPATTGQ